MKNVENIENKIETLKNIIKRNGDRITKPRLAVYQYLVTNAGHFNAQQIFNAVKQSMPDVTLATIYNVLAYLSNLGVIQEIPTQSETLYDGTESPHAHLICMECGKVQDLSGVNTSPILKTAKNQHWRLTQNPVSVFGICPDCQKRSSGSLL
ncbi:Fur family transcriptional regulator [Coprothermobacter platensis]|uniref:Fur family transcriptional regulator n=1 Tax=Coprothermobacter platensis TaxID=108819 RepID=UPI0003645C63|nr:Fur family transcriptional regulator [Coprothermobacter platensis]